MLGGLDKECRSLKGPMKGAPSHQTHSVQWDAGVPWLWALKEKGAQRGVLTSLKSRSRAALQGPPPLLPSPSMTPKLSRTETCTPFSPGRA